MATEEYTNDLRLIEITPGAYDGTWGTYINSNFELLGEGFGYGTISFASDANETFTIADGSTDPVRCLFLKVTSAGTLTATRTATLAPNTVNKVWIIENATTGSQSIEIKQGSGATVTIGTGRTVMVYADGAGSGGAVTEINATNAVAGAPVLLDATTFSTDAEHTVSWTGTYSAIELTLANVIPVTDAVDLVMVVSTDAGSTYRTSATSYKNGGTESASMSLNSNIGSDTNEVGVCGKITIYAPAEASYHLVHWELQYIASNGNADEISDTWVVQHAEDIDAYKITFSSGSIESGEILTFGIENS